MKMKSHCPINYSLEHFGDRWSLLIIRDLMFNGKRHYNEFLESGEKISTSVLGDRLKHLEETGIISKEIDSVKKSRIRYSLTEKGISMLPIMLDMVMWGGLYDSESDVNNVFLTQVNNERELLIKSTRERLEKEHLEKSNL
ncbi:helix-turn-helix transcriptional regulator [Muricauda oceani]|uniref:Helix-turn-helix transcriptional regulator n=1 Tax=Flagellimonas oceani TaxID=2698672 RepID=A0A6G7IZU8_9FLAO|nr:helix-turn-helix domain-containing protein [Allomuricauda oceani]MBW8244778.1 helix-turn-helix transcriptional regulator [Allomuricauda oceani]QII43909.1 helix-turn-helix transcriptional regulator [Allomuricauda oceani]